MTGFNDKDELVPLFIEERLSEIDWCQVKFRYNNKEDKLGEYNFNHINFYNSKKELDTYNSLKIGKHIHNISLSLSELFESLNADKPLNFDNLNKEILNYFEEFEIYFSDTPKGIYWNIPVNF